MSSQQRVEREYPRPIERDLAASIEAMAQGLGPASRMTAAVIVCKLRGLRVEDLDPRAVARLQGRGVGWLIDSGARPTSRPVRGRRDMVAEDVEGAGCGS